MRVDIEEDLEGSESESGDDEVGTPREFWEEYERRKAKIQNIGLTSDEYDKAIARILEDLDSEGDDAVWKVA